MAKENKVPVNTTYGDPNASYAESRNDDKEDFDSDSSGVKAASKVTNFFPVTGTFGDRGDATQAQAQNDNVEDFGQDSAGVPNVDQGEQTDLDMALAPNKFPRETGSDTMTDEELSYI